MLFWWLLSVQTTNGITSCTCDTSYTCSSQASDDDGDDFINDDPSSSYDDNANDDHSSHGAPPAPTTAPPTAPPTCTPVTTTYTRSGVSPTTCKTNTCNYNCTSQFIYQQFANCSVMFTPTVSHANRSSSSTSAGNGKSNIFLSILVFS